MTPLIYLEIALGAFILGGILVWLIHCMDNSTNMTYGRLLSWATLSAITGPFGLVVSVVVIFVILVLMATSVVEQWLEQIEKPKWWDKKL